MIWRLALTVCTAILLLAACSTPAIRPAAPLPTPLPAPVTRSPTQLPLPPVATTKPAPSPPSTWQRLRASFGMDDCAAPVMRRARRETRNKEGFEEHMRQLLPIIAYVQKVAAEYHVAGEFALLPWVESHFHQTPPRRHRPAGMWQIMPATARVMHLGMSRRYDGRLDPVASTHAVMQLLSGYYRTWPDWRVVDMAYNTGKYRLGRILKAHGMPPAMPVIPRLPVGHVTRQHLSRLLAIACVIRDPHRFGIHLPTLPPNQRLETVQLPGPTSLRQVARLTGLSSSRLRKLNAGYRLASIPAGTPMRLLLPAPVAQMLRQAIADGRMQDDAGRLATGRSSDATYTVVSGDSLWSIAQRFNVEIGQLRQWNDLDGSLLHPGQVLQLEPPPSS